VVAFGCHGSFSLSFQLPASVFAARSRPVSTCPPWLQHNKRERHRIVRFQVESPFDTRPPKQTAHPSAVRAGGRVLPQITVLESVNSPIFIAVVGNVFEFANQRVAVRVAPNGVAEMLRGQSVRAVLEPFGEPRRTAARIACRSSCRAEVPCVAAASLARTGSLQRRDVSRREPIALLREIVKTCGLARHDNGKINCRNGTKLSERAGTLADVSFSGRHSTSHERLNV
jgi:hypothetical protein